MSAKPVAVPPVPGGGVADQAFFSQLVNSIVALDKKIPSLSVHSTFQGPRYDIYAGTNNIKIEAGSVKVTDSPSSGGNVFATTVKFKNAFSQSPMVVCTPYGADPVGICLTKIARDSFTVKMIETQPPAKNNYVNIIWMTYIAIGPVTA